MRQILVQVEQTLNLIDNCTNVFFTKAPQFLQLHQQRLNQLRQLYQQLDLQVKQVQQVMVMFWWLRTVWYRFSKILHFKSHL